MDPLNLTDVETIAALEALAKEAGEEYRIALRGLSCAKAASATAPPGFAEYSDQHERALKNAQAEEQTRAGRYAALNRAIDVMKAARDLVPALADVFALIDEGFLVRDTSKDMEPGFALKMLPYVSRLKAAHDALGRPGAVLR